LRQVDGLYNLVLDRGGKGAADAAGEGPRAVERLAPAAEYGYQSPAVWPNRTISTAAASVPMEMM